MSSSVHSPGTTLRRACRLPRDSVQGKPVSISHYIPKAFSQLCALDGCLVSIIIVASFCYRVPFLAQTSCGLIKEVTLEPGNLFSSNLFPASVLNPFTRATELRLSLCQT